MPAHPKKPSAVPRPFGIAEPYDRFVDDQGEVTSTIRTGPKQAAPIELSLIRRRGASEADANDEWVALEIWTRNRMYLVSGLMKCIGVFDTTNNSNEPKHKLLGAVLTGGRSQVKGELQLSQPYPIPGMKAVFRYQIPGRKTFRFVTTSEVSRVMLRVGVTTFTGDEDEQSFHELTARFFL